MTEHEQHIVGQEARAGSAPHVVRHVPGISLTLAIIGMIVILWGN